MLLRINPSLGLIIIFLALSLRVTTAERQTQPSLLSSTDPSYIREIEKWRTERSVEINGEDGWTTLLGLFWLNQGRNRFGSDPSNDIVLPQDRAPRFAGSIWLGRGTVTLHAKPHVVVTSNSKRVRRLVLRTDAGLKPTVLKLGSLTLFVIKRGERLGLRLKDKKNPARSHFAGLDYFPVDMKWRLEAKLEPYNPPKVISIVNVLGMVDNMTSPGALAFEVNGEKYRLDPVLEKGEKHLFLIFSDTTAGKETYGAGRYLYVDPPDSNGRVIVDFNKAHNPPCAFTRFATCPLPPSQNHLSIRIDAGEKKYSGAGH